MDWASALEALGGGTSAIIIVALVWDRMRLSTKNDTLSELLMQRKDDELRASVEREIAVRHSLEQIFQLATATGALK
jgi:hypothetical protein